jgi:hypothetical protein
MSDAPELPLEKKDALSRSRAVASLVRDIGMILGIPALFTIGLKLYEIQTKALEAQIKASETQIKVLESQNALLKETQYDRALTIIKSQKELFSMERSSLEKQISDLKASGHNLEEEAHLAGRLIETQERINASDAAIAALAGARVIFELSSQPPRQGHQGIGPAPTPRR